MYKLNSDRSRKILTGWFVILLAILIQATPYRGFAQAEETPTSLLSTEAPTLRFEHIKVGDGLQQGSANSIFQDSQGYIWITTQSGLHRYDGYEFKVFDYVPFDTTSLSEGWLWAVDESKNGDLWVTTNSSGLNRMDRATGTFKHYMHDPGDSTSIASNFLFFPFEDSRGDLWVGSQRSGLDRMRAGDDGRFEHYRHVDGDPSTLSSDGVYKITEDPDGNIWVGSTNGINRINHDTGEITRFLYDPDGSDRYGTPANVLSQYHSKKDPGILWLATGNGLVRLDSHTGVYQRFLIEPNGENVNPLNLIHEVVPDPDIPGVFWVAGPGTGVARFDERTEKFTSYRHDPRDPNSLAEDNVQTLFSDRAGTMWVGYTAEGISSFNPGAVNFSHLRNNPEDTQSLSPGLVWGVYEDSFGTLWVGTDAGPSARYLTQYFPDTGVIKIHQSDPNDTNTLLPGAYRAFAEDEDGRFWVAGNTGLNLFNRETGRVTRFQHDQSRRKDNIFVLKPTADDGSKFWIASFGGLELFDTNTNTFLPVNIAPEGRENEPGVISLYEDTYEHVLWLGSFIGLIRYDLETKTSEAFSYNPADTTTISENAIFDIHKRDSEPGILWLGTQNSGLDRFDIRTHIATHFTKEDGLPDNHIYSILEDDEGTLWMSTNGGISNYNPNNNTFRNYGLDDGLMALEYDQNAYFKGASGVFYFGNVKGVTAFIPEQLRVNETPPQVTLSGFKISNKPVTPGPGSPLKKSLSETETITLKYNQNEVAFDYVALHFTNSNRNQYKYQLVGYDENWVDAGTRRTATYTNLPPGDYTFRVIASNSDGVWNDQGASVNLSISPPWYETWWAYGLFAGMFGFMVFGVDRVQRKRLGKKERERSALREAELRAEAENKRRADTEQLSKIGQTITSTLSVDEIIETVYENVNALMDAAIFSVGIYNEHLDRLDFPATKEKGEMLPAYSYSLDEEARLAVWCFKNKKEIIVGDFINEYKKYIKEYKPPVEGEIPASVLYLPLVQQGRVIGVVTTQSFKKNAYTEYHINLLRNLATYAAIALDNASAYRQLNATLSELKTTQTQLVQQEKLASLGQLTAGIAHEIKNPLNFVNNFSDLSMELVEEVREEVKEKLTTESNQLTAILDDLETNLRKIHDHGTRADGIVRSMLLHSRGGSGKKEPTDLNALLKEYVNLAFHGMRAGKDPINVDIDLDLDEKISEIKLIREDFSRVILNLCNNAFDAMGEKLSAVSSQLSDKPDQHYEPKLTVRTLQKGSSVTIEIEDNGPGIPEEIKDKILQPFFTTKKGTQGTGLGLSITNDIIKAHGGMLEIDSKENKFTRFTIHLNNNQ